MPRCIIAVPHQALASGHFLRSYDFARLESCCQRCAERPIGPSSCASHFCWECFERNYNENGQKSPKQFCLWDVHHYRGFDMI